MKTLDQILKIKAVVLYILNHMPEGVDYIHLFKTMYFAHQEHLVKYGLPLMDDTFVALKYGPVPSFTYKAMCVLEGKVPFETEEMREFISSLGIRKDKGYQVLFAMKDAVCDMDELSVSNVKVLDEWIAKCKDIETFDLSDMSHRDKAWIEADKQSKKTGEKIVITQYSIAKSGGATNAMLSVIKERQNIKNTLVWI